MARPDFHERFEAAAVKPPSDRATGVVFTVVAILIAVVWRSAPVIAVSALCIALVLGLLSLLAPARLKPLNVIWFRFGLLLHRIVNPVVMGVLFLIVIVPAGLLMQRFYDPLNRRGRARDAASYWVPREQQPPEGSMRNQF